jgi:hypothetical protein
MTNTQFTLKQLQSETKLWAEHNFGNVNKTYAYHPLLGMIEEMGELEIALDAESSLEIQDAIGDVIIYMADYCNRMQFNLEVISNIPLNRFPIASEILPIIGRICHGQLKLEQNIRGSAAAHIVDIHECLCYIIHWLNCICLSSDWNFLNIVRDVWESVHQRDWKRNAEDGGTQI